MQGTPDTLTVNASIEFHRTRRHRRDEPDQRAPAGGDRRARGPGIDRKDISTTQVSLQPQYGSDSTTITGYQASNSIDVKIRNLDAASDAIGLIVNTGGNATRINSVSYSIEDDSQLVKDARARAFNDAKDRAEQYAQLSGLEPRQGHLDLRVGRAVPPPTPTPMPRGTMEAAVPLEPGQQTVGFSVTVIWELT